MLTLSPLPFAILLFASLLHGLTGMGFPLIATPTLAFFLPLATSLAILAIPTLILNAMVVFGSSTTTSAKSPAIKPYLPLILTSIIGSIIGVKLLFVLPVIYLNALMAVVILYYAIQGLLSLFELIKPLKVPTGKLSMASFGLLSGLIGGATNAMSPILMMYLFSKTDDKNDIAKISNVCFLFAKLTQIALLWQEFQKFTPSLWLLTAIITALSMLGIFAGIRLRDKINQQTFKGLIYLILLGLGAKIGYGVIF